MNQTVRLIAFDMDGTVLHDGKEISDRLKRLFQKALAQGIYVVPCTGRGHGEVPASVMSVPVTHTITSNGALCMDEETNQILHTNLIPWEPAVKIYEELKKLGVFVTLHMDGLVYFETNDEQYVREVYHMADYLKINLIEDAKGFVEQKQRDLEKIYARAEYPEQSYRVREKIAEIYPLYCTSSSEKHMEFGVPGCTKASGLKWLCQHLQIEPSQVIAFGDGDNDKEMLAFAGTGVAMANGSELCKAAADVVIGSCGEDAVAEYLEGLL